MVLKEMSDCRYKALMRDKPGMYPVSKNCVLVQVEDD